MELLKHIVWLQKNFTQSLMMMQEVKEVKQHVIAKGIKYQLLFTIQESIKYRTDIVLMKSMKYVLFLSLHRMLTKAS